MIRAGFLEWTGVGLAVVVAFAGSPPSPADAPREPGARLASSIRQAVEPSITPDLFSGRANPSWKPDPRLREELSSRLAGLQPAPGVELPDPALGYRGFEVAWTNAEGLEQRLRIPRGWIVWSTRLDGSPQSITFRDEEQRLEKWLIEHTARQLPDYADLLGNPTGHPSSTVPSSTGPSSTEP